MKSKLHRLVWGSMKVKQSTLQNWLTYVDFPAWLSKNVAGNANHKSWLTSPIRQKFHVIWCSTLKQWPYTWCYPFSSHWDAQYLHQTMFFSDCSLVTVTRPQSWRTTMRHVTSSFLKLSFGLQTTPTYLTTCKLF